jgi:hypothetical protein
MTALLFQFPDWYQAIEDAKKAQELLELSNQALLDAQKIIVPVETNFLTNGPVRSGFPRGLSGAIPITAT